MVIIMCIIGIRGGNCTHILPPPPYLRLSACFHNEIFLEIFFCECDTIIIVFLGFQSQQGTLIRSPCPSVNKITLSRHCNISVSLWSVRSDIRV